MGLFDLFRGDPIARAERALTQDDPRAALVALGELKGVKAETLRQQAEAAVVDRLVGKADRAEAAGHPGDAADWLRMALDELADGAPERAELEARIAGLDQRVGQAAAEAEAAERAASLQVVEVERGGNEAGAAEAGAAQSGAAELGIHPDDLFDNLVEMLSDDTAAVYREAPEAFRHAWVKLNQGEADEALTLLESVTAELPVVALEKGRAYLALDQVERAAASLETAWDGVGSDPIDHAGAQSVPQLWAEAMLATGEHAAVVERLAPLVDAGPRTDLADPYARALLATERPGDAAAVLQQSIDHGGDHRALVPLLADCLDAAGDPDAAIDTLESLIAPSCATGSCQRPPLHLGAVRSVVKRYLARGEEADLELAREHLERLIAVRQGALETEDIEHLIAYYHAIDEPDRVAELRQLIAAPAEPAT